MATGADRGHSRQYFLFHRKHRSAFSEVSQNWVVVRMCPEVISDGCHINLHRADQAKQEVKHRNDIDNLSSFYPGQTPHCISTRKR